MKMHAIATAGAVAAVTVIAPAAAYADTTATPSGSTATTCGALPAYVQGRPAHLHARGATGDYLWHDSAGWHLRVTHPTKQRMVFGGVITASRPLSFHRVADEAKDKVSLSNGGKTMTFRFVNYGGIDGVDFTDACAGTMKVALSLNGHRVGRNQIYVGGHSARPGHNPFTISRVKASSAA